MAVGGGANQYDYYWFEMTFFTRWTTPGGHTVLCLDVPDAALARLQALFLSPSKTLDLSDIYSPHLVIVDEIIRLFDISVWSLRNIVRTTELVRLLRRLKGRKVLTISQNRLSAVEQGHNFPLLHDFARHTIHSSETLEVALETMDGILEQHKFVSDAGRQFVRGGFAMSQNTMQHLYFQIRLIRSVRARSHANEARLRNEINLVS